MNLTNILYQIQSQASNAGESSDTIILPENIKLYNVDLNSRIIESPSTLSVQSDHYAETFYFLVDRFYDNMDLAQTNCVIQYVTGGECYVYAVPFCDITTFEGKMIIPWNISASVTQNNGTIKYFIRFYLVNKALSENSETQESEAYFTYSLSTLPATSTILKSFSSDNFINEDTILEPDLELSTINDFQETLLELGLPERYLEIVDIFSKMVDNATVYWNDV